MATREENINWWQKIKNDTIRLERERKRLRAKTTDKICPHEKIISNITLDWESRYGN